MILTVLLSVTVLEGCSASKSEIPSGKAAPVTEKPAAAVIKVSDVKDIQTPPPPFSDGIFPCTACHADMPVNRTRRKLVDMHDDIVLKHGPKSRWCFDCHDAENRDMLHLANGKLIPFTRSYLLCGQCHGDKLRDWKVGVHGKRTGYWDGQKTYLLCPTCHNPHSPHFKPLKPKPSPVPPAEIIIPGGKHS